MIKLTGLFLLACITIGFSARAESMFFEDEPIQQGLNVADVSATFADIYKKLDSIKWAGKNLNIAIESLEKINKNAHIAATDARVVLVWGDTIVANYPRPAAGDWNSFGEITTALILKMRERDANLRAQNISALYETVVGALMRGIDENGRYIYSVQAQLHDDGRLLTSAGLIGVRDARGNFRVTGVYKGSTADAAGISAGDLISEINGMRVADMSVDELDAVMSGFNSGTAKITLVKPAGARRVVLRRATVVMSDA